MIVFTLSWSLPNFWEDLRRRWSISIGSVLSSLFSFKKEVEESWTLHLIVLVSFPTSISVSSGKLPIEQNHIYCDIKEYLGFTLIQWPASKHQIFLSQCVSVHTKYVFYCWRWALCSTYDRSRSLNHASMSWWHYLDWRFGGPRFILIFPDARNLLDVRIKRNVGLT